MVHLVIAMQVLQMLLHYQFNLSNAFFVDIHDCRCLEIGLFFISVLFVRDWITLPLGHICFKVLKVILGLWVDVLQRHWIKLWVDVLTLQAFFLLSSAAAEETFDELLDGLDEVAAYGEEVAEDLEWDPECYEEYHED